ncbi:MAG: hypothetical protein Q8N59_03020 [bacterium]|nr:hypothetical protein [bacterium]
MAKVCLFVSGNAFHSFLLGDRWQKMYDEQLGLNAIGRSGIPITVGHQGIDYELYPFLKDVHRKYPNISVVNATYTHSLLPLIPSEESGQKKWETRNLLGDLPITFFSEFYGPEAEFIPTEFFFFLRDQTCSYSINLGTWKNIDVSPDVDSILPFNTISVKYLNHIGIVMDGFKRFNEEGWFKFAAMPNQANLSRIMFEFEAMLQDPRKVIVVPMDLEQPYVGSVVGEKLWTMFFDEIKRRGFAEHIVGIQSFFDDFRNYALPIKRPHRILSKWTTHLIQLQYLQHIARFRVHTEKERLLYALTLSSDLLSSWNRYVQGSTKYPVAYSCETLDGAKIVMSQGPNIDLQEECLAACQVLEKGDKKFTDKIAKINNSGLIPHLAEWAARKGI